MHVNIAERLLHEPVSTYQGMLVEASCLLSNVSTCDENVFQYRTLLSSLLHV